MSGVALIKPNGVLVDSSIYSINTKLTDVLNYLLQKAKDSVDNLVVFKKTELAKEIRKDVKTVGTHIKELSSSGVFELGTKRGKNGGSVIKFNETLVQFTTSKKSLLNQKESTDLDALPNNEESLDDVAKQVYKKKKKPVNPNRRARRTKAQMLEAKLLQSEHEKKIDELHQELEKSEAPTWDWFQKTDNPIFNYRTYLVSRMYNRYAFLYTKEHNDNHAQNGYTLAKKVNAYTPTYDVLPELFLDTVNWNHFKKFVEFCDDNSLHPLDYLTAQFNHSIYYASLKDNVKSVIPFPNALIGERCYEVYQREVKFQKAKYSVGIQSYKYLARFTSDTIMGCLKDAYDKADTGVTSDFMKSVVESLRNVADMDGGSKVTAVVDFMDIMDSKVQELDITDSQRETVNKFITMQSLIMSQGLKSLPKNLILGSSITRLALHNVKEPNLAKDVEVARSTLLLGSMLVPTMSQNEQYGKGIQPYQSLSSANSNWGTLRLIEQRNGLDISFNELRVVQRKLEEAGFPIPLNDYSLLDVNEIYNKLKHTYEMNTTYGDYIETIADRVEPTEMQLATRISPNTVQQEVLDIDKLIATELNGNL